MKEEKKIGRKGVGENCGERWGDASGRDAERGGEGICGVGGVRVLLPTRRWGTKIGGPRPWP